MALWTAFTIGLFGSLHCIGMCGPIAISLPFQSNSIFQTAGKALIYNLGRVTTYSFFGAFIGLLGQGLVFTGFQRWFTIAIGILLLLSAFLSINLEHKIVAIPFFNKLYSKLKNKLSGLLKSQAKSSLFWVGILNGFLPCGLVWLAIVGAVSTGNILDGMLYMMLFGFGTLPLMLLASLAGNWVSLRFRKMVRKLVPVFLMIFATLFIFRGLNFQIPADFNFWEAMQNIPMCH